jgi:ribosomal protein S18 acetylase RimI-like enzyme
VSNQEYTIRPATADDADAVTEMWQEMIQQHRSYDSVRWGWNKDAHVGWRQHFIESVAKENSIVLVAVDLADRPIGYLMGSTGPTVPGMTARCRGEVSDMFIRPDFRDRGIGRMLMETATEIMKSRGAVYILLYVAIANERAIDFYKSLGMQAVVHQMYKRL